MTRHDSCRAGKSELSQNIENVTAGQVTVIGQCKVHTNKSDPVLCVSLHIRVGRGESIMSG